MRWIGEGLARRTRILWVGALLLAPTFLAAVTGPAAAALTVDAPGWSVVWPGTENTSAAYVYSPGDVTGDGIDDLLLVYPGGFDFTRPSLDLQTSFELYAGSDAGLRPHPVSRSNGSQGGLFGAAAANPTPKDWDFNGDGHADVAFGGGGSIAIPEDFSTSIDIWLGSAAGFPASRSCTKTVPGSLGDGYGFASWAALPDLNGDGRDDIVAIRPPGYFGPGPGQDSQNNSMTVIWGTAQCSDQTVRGSTIIRAEAAGGAVSPLGAADFNADGYADLVTDELTYQSTGAQSHRIRVYPGTSGNLSAPGSSLSLPATGALQFFVGVDMNSPGDYAVQAYPDLAVGQGVSSIGGGERFELVHYRGSSQGLDLATPYATELAGPGLAAATASLGDLNGDGNLDVVLTNSTIAGTAQRITARAYIGLGDSFSRSASWTSNLVVDGLGQDTFIDGSTPTDASADLDGDGLSDIAVLAAANPYGGIIFGQGPSSSSSSSAVLLFYGRQIVQYLAGVGPYGFDRGVGYPSYEYGFDVTAKTASPSALDRVAVSTPAGNFTYEPSAGAFGFEPNLTLGTVEFVRVHGASSAAYDDNQSALIVHFRFEFTWDFPIEDEVPYRLLVSGPSVPPTGPPSPVAGTFRVEKDVEFSGELALANATTGAALSPDQWVAGQAGLRASGLTAHFEGAPAWAVPADAFRWILADSGGGTWSQGPGAAALDAAVAASAISMPSDSLAVTLSDLPNAEVHVPTASFPYRVDADVPLFGAVLPESGTWVASHEVTVAAEVTDPLSGADPSRVEFQVSTTGPSGFGLWHDASFDGTNLTHASAVASANFLDGEDNYFRFRVWDAVGNGPSESGPFQVRVDTLHVIFEGPAPPSDAWQNTNVVKAAVTVRDLGASGVRSGSVAYRVSTAGLFGFGPWQPVSGITSGVSVRPEVTVSLLEGDQNFVQWRAEDVVGTGLTVSEGYRVIVDATAPTFGRVLPNAAERLLQPVVIASVNLTDGVGGATARSGVSPGSVEYRYTPPGGSVGNWTHDGLDVSGPVNGSWRVTVPVLLQEGRGNRIQFRASDLAGNGPALSEVASYFVNSYPTIGLGTNATNDTVYLGQNISLFANVSDPDGDRVSFSWYDNGARVGENNTPEISLNLPKGNWTFRVIATDAFGMAAFANITVHVVDPPPPPPPPPPLETPTQAGDDVGSLLLILAVAALIGGFIVVRRMRRTPPRVGP